MSGGEKVGGRAGVKELEIETLRRAVNDSLPMRRELD